MDVPDREKENCNAYIENGHSFYRIDFPTVSKTWWGHRDQCETEEPVPVPPFDEMYADA